MTTLIYAHPSGNFRKSGSGLRPLVFYFSDFFDPIILENLSDQLGQPDAVLSDIEGTVLDIKYPFYFIPSLNLGLLNLAARPLKVLQHHESLSDIKTDFCFCWSINRKHIDRHIVIKLIEFFDLKSYTYTWSGIDKNMDMQPVINEISDLHHPWLTESFRTHLLSPIKHESRWVDESCVPGSEISGVRRETGGVVSRWQNVDRHISLPSAVYLLTESMYSMYPNYTFSERTAFCLLSGCFPIWAGNFGQADMAKHMGIDIFDDVINHDYQYKTTLLERCWYAISDNLEILQDVNLARHLRSKFKQRLENNRHWLFGSGLESFVQKQFDRLKQKGVILNFASAMPTPNNIL